VVVPRIGGGAGDATGAHMAIGRYFTVNVMTLENERQREPHHKKKHSPNRKKQYHKPSCHKCTIFAHG
jgi:hypothetical protein